MFRDQHVPAIVGGAGSIQRTPIEHESESESDRAIERRSDRETERQRDRATERQRDRERNALRRLKIKICTCSVVVSEQCYLNLTVSYHLVTVLRTHRSECAMMVRTGTVRHASPAKTLAPGWLTIRPF